LTVKAAKFSGFAGPDLAMLSCAAGGACRRRTARASDARVEAHAGRGENATDFVIDCQFESHSLDHLTNDIFHQADQVRDVGTCDARINGQRNMRIVWRMR